MRQIIFSLKNYSQVLLLAFLQRNRTVKYSRLLHHFLLDQETRSYFESERTD